MALDDFLDTKDVNRLDLTQATREQLILKLVGEEVKVPDTKADQELLIRLMDGSDRAVYSKAKLLADDKHSKANQSSVQMIAQVLSRYTARPEGVRAMTSLELDTCYQVTDLVPGELEFDNRLNHEEFLQP